jgi:hypothetical protein
MSGNDLSRRQMEVQQPRPHEALRAARYRKSSQSSGAQECLAIGHACGWTGVRDTKAPDGQDHDVLAVPTDPFTGFLAAVKSGRFDR